MTVNIAQIGLGYWGRNLARNLLNLEGARLHTLCELNPESSMEFGSKNPDVQITGSYDSVMAAEDIQAVVIATPAETHYALARRALINGKDVFVEKPLSLTYAEGADLVHIASERGRILMVGHVLEYHPAIVRLNQLVANGDLGKIRYIYSNRLSLGKIRREENILWSFAPHDVAVILRLMGGLPFQVSACGGAYIQPNIADVTVTNLLFDNGVRAHIYVSWLHPFKEQRLVVIGSKRMASFDDVSKRLTVYDQRVDLREGEPIPVRGEGEDVPFTNGEPLRLEGQAFLNAIITRKAPLTDGLSGVRVLKVLQAAQRSLILNGEPVALRADLDEAMGLALATSDAN